MKVTPLSLLAIAQQCELDWSQSESVDWSEAEELVQNCKNLDSLYLTKYSQIQDIIDYSNENLDWDSSEVASWPSTIIRELATSQTDGRPS
ncbi:hypothetical protein L1D14_22990 [Vibrio tubiashii]|uniref:hypothetical protein n=1 Tax=Vibrio tubiashii TaxID=29498 RepID=UPI001EFC62DE|nr:hypothetical protein [Vibrio tubiashii]MCG9579071.1 hypothetical protein [Vibrio tubiashii]